MGIRGHSVAMSIRPGFRSQEMAKVYRRRGAVSQWRSIELTADVHSVVNAVASCCTPSADAIWPPHIAGWEAW